jgi:hypothetical protein
MIEGNILKKNIVFEIFDQEMFLLKICKIEKLLKCDKKMYVVYKYFEKLNQNFYLDCFEVSSISTNFFFIELDNINLSRLSYIYHSVNGQYVNLNIK